MSNNQPEDDKGVAARTMAQIQAQIAYMWVGPSISFLVLFGFFFMLYKLLSMDPAALAKLGVLGTFYLPCSELWVRLSRKSSTIGWVRRRGRRIRQVYSRQHRRLRQSRRHPRLRQPRKGPRA